jgi:hypothetical protein
MTTLTATYHNPPRIGITVMICVLLVVVGVTMSHAITKHGENAIRVSDCMDNKGPVQEWYNAGNGHTIYICQIEPNVFGIDVLFQRDGRWERLTSFVKEKLKTLADVERYMRNSGATRIK